MSPHRETSPVEAAVLRELPRGAIAYDLIYTPRPTRFLQLSQDTSSAVIFDGLEMLIQQGAAALELWIQQSVPVDIMRSALNNAVD